MPQPVNAPARTERQPVLLSKFDLKIGGKAVPEANMTELMRDVIEIVVDDTLHMPDMFTIHLHDKRLKWIDAELLAIGKEVEIAAKPAQGQDEDDPERNLLMKGEITALEPDFTSAGEPTLLVRGYDKSHRLHRGKQTRSFLQTTDSEIVKKIAQEVKLKVKAEPTSTLHEYVLQNNQTNLEFLLERAGRIGYQLDVEGETLRFCRGDKQEDQGPELQWGRNLSVFRPRLTVVGQASEVVVRGWDPKAKREIVGRASKGKLKPDVGLREAGGQVAEQAFHSPAQAVVVDYPVASQDEAQAMAQALCNTISGEFIQAEGVCLGDSRLGAGKMVRISGVGERFSGRYFVTQATHTYSAAVGYETTFSITGRQPNTLSDLIEQRNGSARGLGVVIGLVTNNRDPEGLGRVKVKFPWLADDEESTWARLAAPMAGQGGGFFYVPEVNDEVLLAFEHGDIHYPYVLGTLWNGADRPPEQQTSAVGGDGKVNKRLLKSRSGHRILLDDSSGQEKIEIVDKSGSNSLTFNTTANSVTLSAGMQLTIKANTKILIQCGTQMINMDLAGIDILGSGRSIVLRGGQIAIG